MNQIHFRTLQLAVDFMLPLNQMSHDKDNCFVVIHQKDKIRVVDITDHPIGESKMLLFLDTQDNATHSLGVQKWKTLLDKLGKLDGSLLVSIQYIPQHQKTSHESN